jgi:hypothetical protein
MRMVYSLVADVMEVFVFVVGAAAIIYAASLSL